MSDELETLRRIQMLLEQILEATLLTDEQKRLRATEAARRQKDASLAEVRHAIEAHRWAHAEQQLAALRSHHPDDVGVFEIADQLTRARSAAREAALPRLRQRADELLAVAAWNEAMQEVNGFLREFPGDVEGQAVLARVTRERDLSRESTVLRLHEEFKRDAERRQWRRALVSATRLIDQFPDHRRAQELRGRVAAIQDNAAIEERNEQTQRIQELIRGKRYAEAIELAEDLLTRFPLSPQAEMVQALLPKLHDRAAAGESESST